ncbi:Hsp20 family protein [Candidatus Dojkabacteria bacterium]|nr:Hsp20 family protein [Candidatus Dojkabacteria bacterium]
MKQTYEYLDSNIAIQVYKFRDRKFQMYPPHNITHKLTTLSTEYTISLAVAGFKRDELSVELDERILTISGGDINTPCWHASIDIDPRIIDTLYSGISTRPFDISFFLGVGVEINNVKLLDGILTVYLIKPQLVASLRRVYCIDVGDDAPKHQTQ